jgi:hypothetical protein
MGIEPSHERIFLNRRTDLQEIEPGLKMIDNDDDQMYSGQDE